MLRYKFDLITHTQCPNMVLMQRSWRAVASLVVLTLLVSGCGKSQTANPDLDLDAEVTAATSSTTTVDPWAVPSTIDSAYVMRVLNELERVHAKVRTDINTTHSFSDQSQNLYREIYAEPQLTTMLTSGSSASTKDRSEYVAAAVPAQLTFKRLGTVNKACVYVVAHLDDNANRIKPDVPFDAGYTLVTAPRSTSNPTGWKISAFYSVDESNERDKCN